MNTIALSFAIFGNIFNFIYNIPFVWVVVKHWNANNISKTFLYIRIFGSVSWLIYAGIISDYLVGASYIVTLTSSLIVSYVKFTQKKKEKENINKNENNKDSIIKTSEI